MQGAIGSPAALGYDKRVLLQGCARCFQGSQTLTSWAAWWRFWAASTCPPGRRRNSCPTSTRCAAGTRAQETHTHLPCNLHILLHFTRRHVARSHLALSTLARTHCANQMVVSPPQASEGIMSCAALFQRHTATGLGPAFPRCQPRSHRPAEKAGAVESRYSTPLVQSSIHQACAASCLQCARSGTSCVPREQDRPEEWMSACLSAVRANKVLTSP